MSNCIVLCAVTSVNIVESECSGHVDSTTCMALCVLTSTGWVLHVRNIYTIFKKDLYCFCVFR